MNRIQHTTIKRIAFINPFPSYAQGTNEATIYPPLGLAYVSAVLEKHDITCTLIDAAVERLTHKEIYSRLKKFKPDAIGISANIVTAKAAVDLGVFLRSKVSNMLLLFGGPHATAEPNLMLTKGCGDIVVRGEGELTIVDIVNNFKNITSIKGISYKRGKKIIHNPHRELIEDIDSIPFPSYHLLPDFRLYKSRSRRTPIGFLLSSRGCPYGCIYCNKNIFGRRFRMRSAANVLTEIELLVGRYGVKQIDVLDDNFTMYIPRAEQICDQIVKRNIRVLLNFQNGVRADKLTPRLVRKMKAAGTYKVGVGIESGDPKIQKIIKKSLKLSKVVRAVHLLRSQGIITVGFFMIGIPGETPTSIQKTIDFAKKVNPHIANFSVVVPLPQTELFEMVQKGGRFTHDVHSGSDTGFYAGAYNFEYGVLNQSLIRTYASRAYRQFYFRPVKILDMVLSIRSFGELRWIVDTARPLVRYLCTH